MSVTNASLIRALVSSEPESLIIKSRDYSYTLPGPFITIHELLVISWMKYAHRLEKPSFDAYDRFITDLICYYTKKYYNEECHSIHSHLTPDVYDSAWE